MAARRSWHGGPSRMAGSGCCPCVASATRISHPRAPRTTRPSNLMFMRTPPRTAHRGSRAHGRARCRCVSCRTAVVHDEPVQRSRRRRAGCAGAEGRGIEPIERLEPDTRGRGDAHDLARECRVNVAVRGSLERVRNALTDQRGREQHRCTSEVAPQEARHVVAQDGALVECAKDVQDVHRPGCDEASGKLPVFAESPHLSGTRRDARRQDRGWVWPG